MLKILFAAICVIAPGVSFGANLCSERFQNSSPQEFFGYFKISNKDLKSLHARRSQLLSEHLIQEGDELSQTGLPKRHTRSYEVTFPQDRKLRTKILIYGEPYLENGTWFIDFKIWSRDWGHKRFIHDREAPYLRRMSLEQFYLIGKDDFTSYLKHLQKVVLVGKGDNKFELLPVSEVKPLQDQVVVSLSKDEFRTIPLQDVMKWNIGIKEDELRLFSDFLLSGGKGTVIYTPSVQTISKIEPARNYLIVEKLPESSHRRLAFLSLLESRLVKAIDEKITIAIVGEGNGIHAATTKSLGKESFENHVLMITPTTHKYIIDHEMKHIEDRKNNMSAKIIGELSVQFPDGDVGLSVMAMARYMVLISEQRAYQTQFESMSQDSRQSDFFILNRLGLTQVSYSKFVKTESAHKKYFREAYVVPLKNDLDSLKVSHYSKWKFLKDLAFKYTLASKDFSLSELFD